MADNVTLGSATYATDDIGGINFPRNKMVFGADGVATDVSAATPLPVDTLAGTGVARQLTAGAASANTVLTTTVRRISMHARGDAIRYAIGTGAQTASATSHFIAAGERLDLAVPANANIAVIRVTTDATLEVTELGAA